MSLLLLFGGAQVLDNSGNVGSRIVAQTSGSTFSRKRWRKLRDELLAAEEAQRAIERKAQEVTGKRRVALKAAAAIAEQAIAAVEDEYAAAQVADLVRLTELMRSAAAAVKLTETVRLANAVTAHAKAMQSMLDEDEEDAIVLLLS